MMKLKCEYTYKTRLHEELSPVVHNELNNLIWDDNNALLPDVKEHILEVVEEFTNGLDITIPILDIQLVGSNASYNYTQHSDIDVHIITRLDDIGEPDAVIQTAMNFAKSKFNDDYDIKFHGLNVEVYVEDIKSVCSSNGIYSVKRGEWIKFPQKLDDIRVELDPLLTNTRKKINDVLESKNSEQISSMIDELYLMRHDSLATNGEYGVGNLVFKQIRNDGLLDGLKNTLKKLRSKELSIEAYEN